MPEVAEAPARALARGAVLLDSNLLIVVFVGFWRPAAIGRRATGDEYDERDFRFLSRLVDVAAEWILTPHLLTEVDNRIDKLRAPGSSECRGVTARVLATRRELRPRAVRVMEEECFPRLGIADSAIVHVARRHSCAVLTSDAALHRELLRLRLSTTYYPAIRLALP